METDLSRWRGAALLAAALATLSVTGCSRGEPEVRPDPVRSSEHVAPLLRPCRVSGFYDRDLTDLAPILVEKLKTGQGEALKRAKEELGSLGEAAAAEIRRLVDLSYADPANAPFLENALDAAAMNPTEMTHDVMVRALDHPMGSVRYRALLGLAATRARPDDFELLRVRVGGNEPLSLRQLYVRALFRSDRARAEDECLGWLERGDEQELWSDAAPRIAESERPDTARRCAALLEELDLGLAVWIAAPAARADDAAALELLRTELEAEDPSRRIRAVQALTLAGRHDELADVLGSDPDGTVRALALAGIAAAPELTPARRGWLLAALDDGASTVRAQALRVLCAAGEPAAIDRALAQLGERSNLLQESLLALRDPMLEDSELAGRVFERLMARHTLEEHRPIQQRAATFKAVGLVPLPEAAGFLRTIGIAAQGEKIESLRAHDWLMIQAANTGQPGRARLVHDLESEDDPLRRIDLIVTIGSARDDAARQALLAIVEGGARTPVEVLVAASRLVKIGPAVVVAPRLKRVSYEIDDVEVRRALQCLLWKWY